MSQFYQYEKHFIIMTEAGAPVYCRFGDEQVLAKLFTTVAALIKKTQQLYSQVGERE